MTVFGVAANEDINGAKTTAKYGNPGDGTTQWFAEHHVVDGGSVAVGAKADAAVSNPASAASVIALLKGLLSMFKAEDAAHVSGDLGIAMWSVRNDALASRASTDGDYNPIATGAGGEQFNTPSVSAMAAATSPTNATSTAYAASLVVKAAAGTVVGLTGYNSKATAQFIQLHNASSLPADTAVPAVLISVPAATAFQIDFGTYGRRFATGIVICNSSTGPTKTIGAADCWFDVQYK